MTGVLALTLTASGTAATAPHAAAAGGTLVMSDTAVGTLGQNFNPFITSSDMSSLCLTDLIYEPLFQYNDLTFKTEPWLATAYKWSDGGRALTFTIRTGVKWSNGSPLTAADVAYTYQLLKMYPALNTEGLSITSISTAGDTVTLKFPKPNYQNFFDINQVLIVPKSIWSKLKNPSTFSDPTPVGTGPFELGSFSPQDVILKRNPTYWQPGLPKLAQIDNPVYNSNTSLEQGLTSNQVQWSQDFIPGLKKIYLAASPYHKSWEVPIFTDALEANEGVFPTNNLAVRKAISLAINRNALSTEAEDGQAPPVTTATGLLLPEFTPLLAPSLRNAKLVQNVAEAKSILRAAGFVMGKNGYFETKSGRELSLTIVDPSSFSDWVVLDQLVVQNLKAAGIAATFDGVGRTTWEADLADGSYQLSQDFSVQSGSPYASYNYWLNSALTAPVGKQAAGDYSRVDSPAIDKDLQALASAGTEAQEKAALAPIEQYMVSNVPVIPDVYYPDFDEYNTQNITGWPTPANPYEVAQPTGASTEVVVLHLAEK